MNNTALLVISAVMGSRVGSLKQIAQMGPIGEIFLDYSIIVHQSLIKIKMTGVTKN